MQVRSQDVVDWKGRIYGLPLWFPPCLVWHPEVRIVESFRLHIERMGIAVITKFGMARYLPMPLPTYRSGLSLEHWRAYSILYHAAELRKLRRSLPVT